MTTTDETAAFGAVIQNLIEGRNLSRSECRAAFTAVLQNRQVDLHQGAFLAALAAKGETADEVAGAWEAIDELDTVHGGRDLPENLVENCGTGMDRLKTFNISTAAALVAAAGGVPVARHGARALTSRCGTVDVAEALGVDVECPVPVVDRSVRTAGIGLYNGMSPTVHPGALGRILAQIRFGSTLNIAASLASPARPRLAVRGVHHPRALREVARAMAAISYRRALVVHGHDADGGTGMDELGLVGTNTIVEIDNGTVGEPWRFAPEDLGLARCSRTDVAPAADPEAAAVHLLQILAGRGDPPVGDTVALNAAAIFVAAGMDDHLATGLDRARELIGAGAPLDRLRRWVHHQQARIGAGDARLAELERMALA